MSGILIIAAIPAPKPGGATRHTPVFYLTEDDFSTPFVTSYGRIRWLPFLSDSFAGFAGFHEHTAQFILGNRKGVAQVIRFAGKLFEVAEIELLDQETSAREEPSSVVYLSERFWRENFNGSPEVLGKMLQVDGKEVRVAGITGRTSGMFAETDLWLPLRSTDPAVRAETMRIIGKLREGADLTLAQKELERLVRRQGGEYQNLILCRMVPVEQTVSFDAGLSKSAGGELALSVLSW